MLVLSRKLGQGVTIAGDIKITVLTLRGGQIRIGIEAPRDMTILRSELLEDGDEKHPTSAD